MRITRTTLLLGPLLLASACADQRRITAPEAPAGPALGAASTETYEAVALGGNHSSAIEMNDHGVLVGVADVRSAERAVYWTISDAGTVTGPVDLGLDGGRSFPRAVNNAGRIIGRDGPDGFVYDLAAATLVKLTRPEGAASSEPWGINNAGVAIGTASFGDGTQSQPQAVLWLDPLDVNRAPAILPRLAGDVAGWARFINDQGVIVGYSIAEDGTRRQVRWRLGADGNITGPHAFGSAAFEGMGFKMNDAGQLPGLTSRSNAAVQQSDGSIIRLDPVAGDAGAGGSGINDPAQGRPVQVVGISDVWDDAEKAVVWTLGADGSASAPVQLPSQKQTTSRAYAINANGWIAGETTDARRGVRVATVWRPQQGSGGGCVPKGNGGNCK